MPACSALVPHAPERPRPHPDQPERRCRGNRTVSRRGGEAAAPFIACGSLHARPSFPVELDSSWSTDPASVMVVRRRVFKTRVPDTTNERSQRGLRMRADDSSGHTRGHATASSLAGRHRGSCIVCQAPVGQADICCSLRCAAQAQQELERNVARVYRLRRANRANDALYLLMARNGQLSQALMRWRSPVPG